MIAIAASFVFLVLAAIYAVRNNRARNHVRHMERYLMHLELMEEIERRPTS